MILVDAHVHIYDGFQQSVFFDAAVKNFGKAAEQKNHNYFLLLSEGAGHNWFFQLQAMATIGNPIGQWTLLKTGEPFSLLLRNSAGQTLYLAAGRQIVSSEKMEVLALITADQFPDGMPFADTIGAVAEAGAIPVIPWGAGKWWGRRGKILENYILNCPIQKLFLGDNGGRPLFWRHPSHFSLAHQKGFQILPGSDPLPFRHEQVKPGSFGCRLPGSIKTDQPAGSLKQILLEQQTPLAPYGTLENPFSFLRNQAAMQIHKHCGR